ncbi:MAG: amino acid-binding ACT [Planctomycetes bacterium]|nr:amino acid-binding ACT [Planctomycetota bacterium]
MSFKWDRVHVWSCEITDQPGSVAEKLAHLAQADANLEYIFTKRLPNKPGFGVLYVAPVTGPNQVRAAKAAGMHEADSPIVRRIEGDNEAGLGHHITQQWAMAGINLQGLTMAVMGGKFIGYAAFDTVHDANRAAQIVADLQLAAAEEVKANGK